MSTPQKTVLITGATGKQGGALLTHLRALPDASSYKLLAVTRNSAGHQARRLAALPGVTVLQGDFADVPALLARRTEPVWGVFAVQVNSADEERLGKALVDAAVAHGVRHFVYASGDRGGPDRSAVDPTPVQNFAAKFAVEKHLQAAAAAGGPHGPMTYTVLRPVTFFENLTADVHGKGFARMWEQLGAKPLQFVSVDDIGWFAAASFHDPAAHAGAALTLVGDELTQPEADAVFRRVTGQPMPLAPCVVASTVKLVLKDSVGDMFRWFGENGYGGSVDACRAAYPEIKDFQAWLEANKGRWVK